MNQSPFMRCLFLLAACIMVVSLCSCTYTKRGRKNKPLWETCEPDAVSLKGVHVHFESFPALDIPFYFSSCFPGSIVSADLPVGASWRTGDYYYTGHIDSRRNNLRIIASNHFAISDDHLYIGYDSFREDADVIVGIQPTSSEQLSLFWRFVRFLFACDKFGLIHPPIPFHGTRHILYATTQEGSRTFVPPDGSSLHWYSGFPWGVFFWGNEGRPAMLGYGPQSSGGWAKTLDQLAFSLRENTPAAAPKRDVTAKLEEYSRGSERVLLLDFSASASPGYGYSRYYQEQRWFYFIDPKTNEHYVLDHVDKAQVVFIPVPSHEVHK